MRGKRPRYNIYIDDAPSLELSDWTIGRFGLRIGDELDRQSIDKIKSAEAEAQAKNIAINFLSYRLRSSKEISDHLIKKGFENECSEKIVGRLIELKMIDDIKFAEIFVRDRLKRKPCGPALLRRQLTVKGIPVRTIDKIIEEFVPVENQKMAALEALKRKMNLTKRTSSRLTEEKRKKRLLDFLLRRGFSYEIALKTIRTTVE